MNQKCPSESVAQLIPSYISLVNKKTVGGRGVILDSLSFWKHQACANCNSWPKIRAQNVTIKQKDDFYQWRKKKNQMKEKKRSSQRTCGTEENMEN